MRRGYLAFVWGVPSRQRGTVDAPIDRHPHAREKMAVREGGREAVTHWELREVFNGRDGKPVASLLACSSRPAAPTRSGCILPISATP